jgi:hypothetical protein
MMDFIGKAKVWLWAFVEIGFVALLAIMLVYLVLGQSSGVFVLGVAANVVKFANEVPAASLAAFGIVGALLYWMTRRASA